MIEIRKNGSDKSMSELDEKMQKLLLELSQNPDPEKEKEIIKLYEQMTEFKPGCAICRNGRNLFMKSLTQFRNGDKLEAMNSLRGSMTAAKVNWHRFKKAFGL